MRLWLLSQSTQSTKNTKYVKICALFNTARRKSPVLLEYSLFIEFKLSLEQQSERKWLWFRGIRGSSGFAFSPKPMTYGTCITKRCCDLPEHEPKYVRTEHQERASDP